MKSIKIYLVLLFVVVCCATLSAQVSQSSYSVPKGEAALENLSSSELWDKANTAYANDNYIKAERMYSEILKRDIHSAALYYNLGNVQHKRGEIAQALLYYYRAEQLAPSDPDILHNIEVLRSKTKDNIEQMPRLFIVEWSEWLGSRLNCMEWSILSLIFLAITLGALLLYLLAEAMKMRRLGFWVMLVVGLLFVVTTHHALVERSELLDPSEAVVMSNSVSVTSSPSRASTELFILHEGTKVEVLTTHDTWSEIKIDDGKRGWVESRRIERI
ncbi:MAG: SH3 domain-containing protein [Rikenellaceae bacterium]